MIGVPSTGSTFAPPARHLVHFAFPLDSRQALLHDDLFVVARSFDDLRSQMPVERTCRPPTHTMHGITWYR